MKTVFDILHPIVRGLAEVLAGLTMADGVRPDSRNIGKNERREALRAGLTAERSSLRRTLRLSLAGTLAAVCLIPVIAGCGGQTPTAELTEPPAALTGSMKSSLSAYTIMRGDGCSERTLECAKELRGLLAELTDSQISIGNDWVKRGESVPDNPFELLIGHTNRPFTLSLEEKLAGEGGAFDFAVKIENDRIAVVGASDAALADGVAWFEANLLSKDALPEAFEYIFRAPVRDVQIAGHSAAECAVVPNRVEGLSDGALAAFTEKLSRLVGAELTGASDAAEAYPLIFGHRTLAEADAWSVLVTESGTFVSGGSPEALGTALDALLSHLAAGTVLDAGTLIEGRLN